MKYLIIAAAVIGLFLECSDSNVKQIQDSSTKKIFSIDVEDGDTTYLRQVYVNNSVIFFICNNKGKPLAGTSTHSGEYCTTVIMPDTVRDTIRVR
jgi:hypothetical protein